MHRRLDLSAATTREIVLTKPDGNLLVCDAALLTDGTDGALVYVTGAGEID